MKNMITISDGKLSVTVLPVGATIYQILFADRAGKLTDMTVGYPKPEDYLNNRSFFGATVGRCANRIAGASFCIDGIEYKLTENNHGAICHSGRCNFSTQEFEIVSQSDSSVTLCVVSPDGTDG
ncbi:MAG: galactose-1-epimerase, partial [Clostridia bacterium]|nr:galactose-1-epimerase [Clostridia bacterium]